MSTTPIGVRRPAAPTAVSSTGSQSGVSLVLPAYVVVAVVAVSLTLVEDDRLSWAGFLLASVLPLIALPLGVRLFEPSSAAPWLMLWAGQVAFFIGDLLLFGQETGLHTAAWTGTVDLAYVAGYPLSALGLALFIRQRLPRHRLAALLDAFIVAVVGAVILWMVLVEPSMHGDAVNASEMLGVLSYPVGDIVLLGAVASLVSVARTGAAARLMAASLAVLLLADVFSATALSGPTGARWADAMWAISYVLIGAAALVPSMRELTEPIAASASGPRPNVRLLGIALLVLPVAASVKWMASGHLHGEVFLVAALVLGALLLLTITDVARRAVQDERRWATLLAKASDAFAVVAADGTLQYVSPASRRITGAPPQDRLGRSPLSFFSLIHPDDRDGPGARLAAALDSRGAVVGERLRVGLADGRLRWLEVLVRNLLDDPDVNGIVINYRDVTEQVEAELELEHRTRLLTAAEGLARVGSWEWHLESGTRHASPGMWSLFGLAPGSVPADEAEFFSRVHPDDIQRVTSAYERLLAEWGTTTLDFRIVRPDGSHVEVHGMGKVEVGEDGQAERVITTFREVTAEREAERQLRSQADILASVREAIVVTDLEGRVTYWGNGAAEMFGYRAPEMLGEPLARIYPEAAPGMTADLAAKVRSAGAGAREVSGLRKDGSAVPLDVRTTMLWSTDGEPAGLVCLAVDVTEQRAARAVLDRLRAAIEQSSESVVITDAEARIEYVNPAFERVTGYSSDEVLGQNPRILKSGNQPDQFYRSMWAALVAGQTWTAELVNRRKDGSTFEERAAISPIRDGAGELTGYVAVKRDVTDERQLEAESRRLARERALVAETIRGFDHTASPEATAEAIGRQLSRLGDVMTAGLFIFGPDGRARPYGFTATGSPDNTFGSVPRRRSRYLRRRAQRGPWIGEWKEQPRHPYNEVFAECGVSAIAYAPVRHAGDVIGFLHIGGTGMDAQGTLASHLPTLVQVADIAGALLGARLTELADSEAARRGISRLIRQSAFVPVFQPIFDIDSHQIVGYEGLTRFQDRVRPDLRFAEAERAGMGQQLELVTLEAALAAARDLPDTVWIDLNVSPGLVMEGAALARLLEQVDRPIVLEVTEHEEIEDYVRFRAAVERLGDDVRIAVDDAGSGYASLRHILELRPALVKLDRALIMGIESDRARRALVAGMRRFAGDTDIRLIAEGVETQPELDTLRDLGIEFAQGFLLGRPLPIGDAVAVDIAA